MMMSLPVPMRVPINNLNAALLGQFQNYILAVGLSQLRLAHLKNLGAIFNLRDCDTLFRHNVFTGDHN